MILTLLDYLWTFSKEPILLVMLVFALINLLLLARLLFKRRRIIEKYVVGPLEIKNDEAPFLIDVANLEEIRPVRVNGNIDIQGKEGRVDVKVQTSFSAEGPDECKYCSIFKDLSSVVCPNCGRLLKVTPQVE
jgi:hypothetical protein